MTTKRNIADRTGKLELAEEAKIAAFCTDGRDYSLYCLTSIEHMQLIDEQWRHLEQSHSDRFSYFQSYEWCHQWCLNKLEQDAAERDTELRVYVLRHKDSIVLICPMMELRTRFGAKIQTFLTDPLAQYSNVLVDRDQVTQETGRRIWTRICKHTSADAVIADRYPSGSYLDEILGESGFAEKSFNEASILDLTMFETWDEHHGSLSRNQRKQRNRRKNKIGKLGVVTYQVSYGGSKRYAELVSMALAMKKEWLENTGRNSNILAQEDTAAFLSGLSGSKKGTSGFPEGAIAQALCVNDEPIAVEIGMVMHRHYYSYLGAFDWSWRDYSPGNIQIEAAQKWAKSAGLESFDFLGDPADYKEQWTGTTHLMHSRSIPRTALGFLYCAIWKSRLRPQLKNVYKNMGTDRRKLSWKVMKLANRPNAADNIRKNAS